MSLDVSEIWQVYTTPQEVVDDSSKDFTVPAATEWQVLWVWVELTTTAVVGNRQLIIQVLDAAGDVLATLARAGAVQAASLTRYYLFAPAEPDMLAFRDTDYLTCPIPPTSFLSRGQTLRVMDSKAIDATHDDMVIQFQYAARAVVP